VSSAGRGGGDSYLAPPGCGRPTDACLSTDVRRILVRGYSLLPPGVSPGALTSCDIFDLEAPACRRGLKASFLRKREDNRHGRAPGRVKEKGDGSKEQGFAIATRNT
jgi:hypothetical protein